MKSEKLNITINPKGFNEYCAELKKSKQGKAIIKEWISQGIIKEVKQ